jgi:hypothetical protein
MSSKPENKYRKETKHFCKFCKIFIQNNLIQITRHEKEPHHLKRMSRLIDSINKTGTSAGSSISSIKPKPKATSINPLLYGLGQDSTADIPNQDLFKRNLNEFKTTEAFEAANPKLVLSANLPSAWEEYVEEPKEEIDLSLNTEMKKVVDDDDDQEDEFKVVSKTMPSLDNIQHSLDNGTDEKLPAFKKKKLKSKLSKK